MRRLLSLATLALFALTLAVLFAPFAGAVDTGIDEPWTNDMNQETYWETRFASNQQTVACTKYENHSGFIPTSYEAAVVKDGNMVRVYNPAPDDAVALGAVNPANGQHFAAPHSWVMKCDFYPIVTTVPEETIPEETTIPQETTTVPTTVPVETTTTIAGTEETTTTLEETTTTILSTVETTLQPVSTTEPGEELPFTGVDSGLLVALGASALTLGGLLLFGVRRAE